jgi:hypothetical protein
MRLTITIIATLLFTTGFAGEVFTGENRNDQFTIHGRLSCYNGGSTYRIWVIGSKRMLYVAGDRTPAIERLNKYFTDSDSWFTHDIFADFTVEPLAPDKKGYMRPVRVIAIKRVVVAKEGKLIAKRAEL